MQIDAAGEGERTGQKSPFRNQDCSASGRRGRVDRFLDSLGIHRLAIPDGPVFGHNECIRRDYWQGGILCGDVARKT